ncbi:hypothetical protein GWL_27160 [Herbaspirillum sp. GW103]|nr:hypothetical protein GWL_27160 [Herbaspirillum sp. GW103]
MREDCVKRRENWCGAQEVRRYRTAHQAPSHQCADPCEERGVLIHQLEQHGCLRVGP